VSSQSGSLLEQRWEVWILLELLYATAPPAAFFYVRGTLLRCKHCDRRFSFFPLILSAVGAVWCSWVHTSIFYLGTIPDFPVAGVFRLCIIENI